VNPRIRLRVAGAPLTSEERWQIHLLGMSGKVEAVVYPDEQRLMELYRSSAALVYPSLHEGFGFPPLEAMACGTVVIAADSSSIPEIVGDAAILFDPNSLEELAERILALRNLGSRRDDLIRRGHERVKKFSWSDTVRKTFEVYQRVAK